MKVSPPTTFWAVLPWGWLPHLKSNLATIRITGKSCSPQSDDILIFRTRAIRLDVNVHSSGNLQKLPLNPYGMVDCAAEERSSQSIHSQRSTCRATSLKAPVKWHFPTIGLWTKIGVDAKMKIEWKLRYFLTTTHNYFSYFYKRGFIGTSYFCHDISAIMNTSTLVSKSTLLT